MNRQQENNCIAYFKSNPVWDRVFVDFGKSTGLMDLFQEKLCYKKLQRRKSKDLRDFLQRVSMGKRV